MSSSKSSDSSGCLAAAIILIVGLPLSTALYALAGMLNWNWFATGLGVPRIGFLQALGLSLVVSAFASGNSSNSSTKKEARDTAEVMSEMFMFMFIRFAFVAGAGWIIHSLIMP